MGILLQPLAIALCVSDPGLGFDHRFEVFGHRRPLQSQDLDLGQSLRLFAFGDSGIFQVRLGGLARAHPALVQLFGGFQIVLANGEEVLVPADLLFQFYHQRTLAFTGLQLCLQLLEREKDAGQLDRFPLLLPLRLTIFAATQLVDAPAQLLLLLAQDVELFLRLLDALPTALDLGLDLALARQGQPLVFLQTAPQEFDRLCGSGFTRRRIGHSLQSLAQSRSVTPTDFSLAHEGAVEKLFAAESQHLFPHRHALARTVAIAAIASRREDPHGIVVEIALDGEVLATVAQMQDHAVGSAIPRPELFPFAQLAARFPLVLVQTIERGQNRLDQSGLARLVLLQQEAEPPLARVEGEISAQFAEAPDVQMENSHHAS